MDNGAIEFIKSPHSRVAHPSSKVGGQKRAEFIHDFLTICPDTRLLWLPKHSDTTTTTDASRNARTFTYDATIAARRSILGSGVAVDFDGTDISSELTITHPNTADFNGKGTLVRVKFGATAGYLTLLKLRTLNALTFNAPVILLAEDQTSKDTYGERSRSIEARWTREVAVAQATVESRRDRKKDPKTVLHVTVPNGSKANLMQILQRGLSDRITVSYSDMGINGDFFIEGHKITVSEGWTLVTRELFLQGV